jgi:hypothetical protein
MILEDNAAHSPAFASFATSSASIERGRLSGSLWTWISIVPARIAFASVPPPR